MNDDRHPIITGIAAVMGVAAAVWATWCNVVAFTGGTLPLLGIEVDGSITFGIVWLFIFDPIIVTVAWWVTMIVLTPFVALAAARETRREARGADDHE